ncbi:hypothetical protein [Deinococcus humi]|uniref:Lipoprotein n=1 Tax=Deinococcus humi TaxID=662880 RepID=A0A7W8K0R2_9DEIO|nr:hypothetical protein [Deinococcus humi]MBB5366368.1 hypothetical protein [Deinococcus humi]GGO41476.1 hypothetical protein GCM10008949_52360 [Deinococcus humi]
MNSKRARLALPLLAATVLLAGCRAVPDVTQVRVPDGPTVFHGSYTGTLTEALQIVAAAPSPDGSHLYAAARTSNHTTLLDLDPATGRELRRVNVPVPDPQDLVVRADGLLVLAGRKASATLDPGTLSILTRLPRAQRISADGERLLVQLEENRVGRIRTRDGSTLPTTALTLAWGFALENVSRDLEWTVTEDGDAVINLSTGARIDTSSGHLNPCPTTPSSGIAALAASAEGFMLGRPDHTLEWRNPDGTLRDVRWLGGSCGSLSQPDWVLALQGTQVSYQRSTDNPDMPGEVAIGRWVPGEEPQVIARTTKTSRLRFRGTFALGTPEAYLQLIALPAEGLRLGGRWEQAYEPPRYPVTTQVTASYRDKQRYDIQGTLNALGLSYAVVGMGTGSASAGSGDIVFTQAICGIPPFAGNCPSTEWKADLHWDGKKVGSFYGFGQDPNRSGPGRTPQEGSLGFSLDGEYRSFGFQLAPGAGPK